MTFCHFLSPTLEAKDQSPADFGGKGGKIQRGRATLGHLANVGEAGRLFFLNGYKNYLRRLLTKRKRDK
jgi:hypothetical protein